jgi:hypothetical protein
MALTKMENSALFLIDQEFPNLRQALNQQQLAVLNSCDQVVSRWLVIGMEQNLAYKDIFQLVKDKVVAFVDVIGKTHVPGFQYQIGEKNICH